MLKIDERVMQKTAMVDEKIKDILADIDQVCLVNSRRVLDAFHKYNVSEAHLNGTTGYGYNDVGRDVIENVFADVLGAEKALVRSQFISGTHALCVALFAYLRPNDLMLSICGKPYDTLDPIIGLVDNASSLKSFGVLYDQIDLVNNDFDDERIASYLKTKKVKLIEIQRSRGYSLRNSISNTQIEKIVKKIRTVDKEVIIMVDNCYCEFVSPISPLAVGADIIVGSLIKNLGGGIAPNGAYIAGRSDLVFLASERLNVPGEALEVGPTLGMNRLLLQGLFMAPSVVASSVKTAVFTSLLLQSFGYKVAPSYDEERVDIVQSIIFDDPNKLIHYCEGIQFASPIDAHVFPVPSEMPGYTDKVIMASGSFTQGSSIELSCDGPLRSPYVAYQQGGLAYEYGKLGVMNAVSHLINH